MGSSCNRAESLLNKSTKQPLGVSNSAQDDYVTTFLLSELSLHASERTNKKKGCLTSCKCVLNLFMLKY